MKEVETRPGKTYAVECVGECTVTNTETGAVVAQGDGSGQVFFTACANSYTVSDDSAKFAELFKLAPRTKLHLLMGGAGGWLPKGFTELEYLESSGTQYIDTSVEMTDDTRIKASAVATAMGNNNSLFGLEDLTNNYILRARQQKEDIFTVQIGYTAGVNYTAYERYFDVNLGDMVDVETVGIQKVTVNGVTKNGNYTKPWQSAVRLHIPIFVTVATQEGSVWHRAYGSYKLCSFAIWQGDKKLRDYAPVLRNADGVPGMFDRVRKRFFENIGTGTFGYRIKGAPATFALRDPHRVAPSGVYARLIAENELEIVADTEETTGEGWEWFANTAEAYEHFGITQEELLTE